MIQGASTPKTVALVPAAGQGRRLGRSVPKPYVEIAGRSILDRTLDALCGAPSIEGVVLVVRQGDEERARASLSPMGGWFRVVPGGPERFDSVRAGLAAVPDGTEIVVVHDGVRPFVTTREIEEVVALAREVGAALTVTTPVETVKRIDGGAVTATLDRRRIRLAQTPQAFRAALLREAYDRMVAERRKTTDEAAAVERLGTTVGIIDADRWNVKITLEEDLRLARWIAGEVRS